MIESYNLLPELKLELGDVFKPELEQILFYFNNERVWTKLVYTVSSGKESEEGDLSFIVDDTEPTFSVENSLEQNKLIFMKMDNMTLLMAIGDAFTESGIEQLID
jgi:hypothetical protein